MSLTEVPPPAQPLTDRKVIQDEHDHHGYAGQVKMHLLFHLLSSGSTMASANNGCILTGFKHESSKNDSTVGLCLCLPNNPLMPTCPQNNIFISLNNERDAKQGLRFKMLMAAESPLCAMGLNIFLQRASGKKKTVRLTRLKQIGA